MSMAPITQDLAPAFNEWMRRYIEEPDRFTHEINSVKEFLAKSARGHSPTYGDECAAYIQQLYTELERR